MMRIQMLHDHERHTGSRRQILQQLHGRFEPTRRAADSDDWTQVVYSLCLATTWTDLPLLLALN